VLSAQAAEEKTPRNPRFPVFLCQLCDDFHAQHASESDAPEVCERASSYGEAGGVAWKAAEFDSRLALESCAAVIDVC
jgi:hypothetical protein